MTGISMGGYGSLKIGLKNPERFKAIAPDGTGNYAFGISKEPHKKEILGGLLYKSMRKFGESHSTLKIL